MSITYKRGDVVVVRRIRFGANNIGPRLGIVLEVKEDRSSGPIKIQRMPNEQLILIYTVLVGMEKVEVKYSDIFRDHRAMNAHDNLFAAFMRK
jgi:hypothetical protein